MSWDDETDEETELGESEEPDETDFADGDEPAEVECPHCGGMISEMAEWCPKCKSYISHEDAPLRVSKLVLWGAGLVLLAVIVCWFMAVIL